MKAKEIVPFPDKRAASFFMEINNAFKRKKSGSPLGVKAWVIAQRAEGRCQLYLICRRKREARHVEVHSFLLCFNHEGLKQYHVYAVPREQWYLQITGLGTEVSFLEAVSLIQDAYGQNLRLQTPVPHNLQDINKLLEIDTRDVCRSKLLAKLAVRPSDCRAFAGIYLGAFRRLDTPLLYDLSSERRRLELGARSEFLAGFYTACRDYIFIKTALRKKEESGSGASYQAYIYASLPSNEVVRISCTLTAVVGPDGSWLADSFVLEEEEVLGPDHPDNPLNYTVCCLICELQGKDSQVIQWLESTLEIFVTGEIQGGTFYKWLLDFEEDGPEFNILDRVFCELLLTKDKLIVYAREPRSLALIEQDLSGCLPEGGRKRYYLTNRELYRAFPILMEGGLFQIGENTDPDKCLKNYLRPYAVRSALLQFTASPAREGFNGGWRYVRDLADGGAYYQKDQGALADGIQAGRWLVINLYQGDLEQEINSIAGVCPVKNVVYDYELESCSQTVINLCPYRKWTVYKLAWLFRLETRGRDVFGIVPSVKEMALQGGALLKPVALPLPELAGGKENAALV